MTPYLALSLQLVFISAVGITKYQGSVVPLKNLVLFCSFYVFLGSSKFPFCTFLVLYGTFWFFWVILGASWYFSVFLGTFWYFLIFVECCLYSLKLQFLLVLFGTFLVLSGTYGNFLFLLSLLVLVGPFWVSLGT